MALMLLMLISLGRIWVRMKDPIETASVGN